jgi:acyl-CoA synthetase (AMP-forming)/AMP-acid ligase II
VMLKNCPEFLELYLASSRSGAIFVPINFFASQQRNSTASMRRSSSNSIDDIVLIFLFRPGDLAAREKDPLIFS